MTLTGPSGVGKTRLAVALGERLRDRFASGTVFVSLAAVSDPEQVLPALARAAGVDPGGRLDREEAAAVARDRRGAGIQAT